MELVVVVLLLLFLTTEDRSWSTGTRPRCRREAKSSHCWPSCCFQSPEKDDDNDDVDGDDDDNLDEGNGDKNIDTDDDDVHSYSDTDYGDDDDGARVTTQPTILIHLQRWNLSVPSVPAAV